MDLAYLAKGVENVVEVDQDLAFSNLGYVVHGLAGVVPDAGILVSEAGEDGWYDKLKIPRKLLFTTKRETRAECKQRIGASGCG